MGQVAVALAARTPVGIGLHKDAGEAESQAREAFAESGGEKRSALARETVGSAKLGELTVVWVR